MPKRTQKQQEWALASIALQDTWTDFFLSRKAMLCSPQTMRWYSATAGVFIKWLQENGTTSPDGVDARHVRAYLASLAERGLKDSSIHGHARAIRTFLRFCLSENYISQPVVFAMPVMGKLRLPVLNAEELKKLLAACEIPRDLALVMFLVDTGARRAELCALNWGDVSLDNGLVRIALGKGKKSRAVVIGIQTRRALIKYRRLVNHDDEMALFQTRAGKRIAPYGVRSLMKRLSKRAEVDVNCHALRRTFAALSLRAGMNVLHLQGLMGHASLAMTQRYVQILDDDLLSAHQKHGPIDNL